MYDNAKIRIKKRLEYWKEVGYDIEYTEMEDRLKVKFTNHSEKIPCYIEYLEDRIICYGDYGSYVFEHYHPNKCPSAVNYKSINYIIGKIDKCINVTKYDREEAEKQIRKFFRELNDYDHKEFDEDELYEMKKELIDTIEEYNYPRLLEELCIELEMYESWYEYFDDFGIVYTEQVLAQLVMMELIDEDYQKNYYKK